MDLYAVVVAGLGSGVCFDGEVCLAEVGKRKVVGVVFILVVFWGCSLAGGFGMVVGVGGVAVGDVLLAVAGFLFALYVGLGAGVWGGDSGGMGVMGALLSGLWGAFVCFVSFLFLDGVSTLVYGSDL